MNFNDWGFDRVSIAFTRWVLVLPMPWVARMIVAAMLLALTMPISAAVVSGSQGVLKPFEKFQDCDTCSEIIVLPAGKYMMGATEEEFRSVKSKYKVMYGDEVPRHEEHVASFAMAKFAVTRGQFAWFAKETGFQGKGCEIFNGKTWVNDANANWQNPGFKQTEDDPVTCVSWDDAQKYIAWLNSKLKEAAETAYRLPTETEWEYAARAGTVTAAYWGNDPQEQCQYENARDESARFLDSAIDHASCTDGYVYTAPVGSFKPNPWGLYDMLGNTSQWVQDCSRLGYYGPVNLSLSPNACKYRALRGTSWAGVPASVRSAMRAGMPENTRDSHYGFRLARSL
ncbi:formylglycine-generating enzyme family protein [Trinickia acidisoli]|uniref:formylglycine-generating enzyme family protein n=1 Tax=Trinickia acidisoli TaxID=2767482 RepID=UPI001A8C7BCE|nr:formylglycine-generating enzyme family protein [Trinickia acidisoli]